MVADRQACFEIFLHDFIGIVGGTVVGNDQLDQVFGVTPLFLDLGQVLVKILRPVVGGDGDGH